MGDVEFGGDRLKPRVVSLFVVVEETNGCWVPFESRVSESIHLFPTLNSISHLNTRKLGRERI